MNNLLTISWFTDCQPVPSKQAQCQYSKVSQDDRVMPHLVFPWGYSHVVKDNSRIEPSYQEQHPSPEFSHLTAFSIFHPFYTRATIEHNYLLMFFPPS